jgi:hypothetical protein
MSLLGELSGEDVAGEFPERDIPERTGGLWHARLRGAEPSAMVSGEDPTDLRDEIRRKLAQAEQARWLAGHDRGGNDG